MPHGDPPLTGADLERVRRAADRLDESLDELGLTRGAPQVKRALELLEGIDGVERLRDADPDSPLPAGRAELERRAEA